MTASSVPTLSPVATVSVFSETDTLFGSTSSIFGDFDLDHSRPMPALSLNTVQEANVTEKISMFPEDASVTSDSTNYESPHICALGSSFSKERANSLQSRNMDLERENRELRARVALLETRLTAVSEERDRLRMLANMGKPTDFTELAGFTSAHIGVE